MSAIAREAGALLLQYFHRGLKIEYKGDADLVTAADRASEALIRERIRKQFPDARRVGRRGTASTIKAVTTGGMSIRLTALRISRTDIRCFAFLWHSNIAEVQGGTRIAGVVYDPTRDELFAAEHGKGAVLNGTPIQVSKATQLKECLVATGFPSHKRHKNPNIYFYHQITLRTHGVRRAGSAALDLCNVACGRFEASGNSISIRGIPLPVFSLSRRLAGRASRFDGSAF